MKRAKTDIYRGLRVLVVDDHMLMRNIVSDFLGKLGIRHIEKMSGGESAWKELQDKVDTNEHYHLMFLDWMMPVMDGMDVLTLVRSDDRFKNLAVIMLTGESEAKSVLKAVKSGATSYITKPVSLNDLKLNLDKVFKWFGKNNINISKLSTQNILDTLDDSKVYGDIDDNIVDSTQFTKTVSDDLQPAITKGIKNIFSELFHVDIDYGDSTKSSQSKSRDMICIGKIHQKGIMVVLRFFFSQDVLRPMLAQFYSQKFLASNQVYEDAACEIVNILCSQIKTFLNSYGYEMVLDIPYIADKQSNSEDIKSAMNIYFTLNDSHNFYIDISTGS